MERDNRNICSMCVKANQQQQLSPRLYFCFVFVFLRVIVGDNKGAGCHPSRLNRCRHGSASGIQCDHRALEQKSNESALVLRQHWSFLPLPRTISIYRRQLNEADTFCTQNHPTTTQLALVMTAISVIAVEKTTVLDITL